LPVPTVLTTARAITAELDNPAGTFVVGADGMADALSVASYAAAHHFAIAIANPDGSIAKSDMVERQTYIVGGKTRVADISGAKRFAGNDRFGTNATVAEGLSFKFSSILSGQWGYPCRRLVRSPSGRKE
jgi:putative cell wall-binding protein